MNIGAYIFVTLTAVGFFLFLTGMRKRKRARLSKGFDYYIGKPQSEADLLRVLVLEELARYEQGGKISVASSRKKRSILTGVFVLLNFVILMSFYWGRNVALLLLLLYLLYALLYHKFDPVSELCKEVKRQPERNISQIVLEKAIFQPHNSLAFLGVGVFVLSLAVFFSANVTERYSFVPAEGGYSVEKYRPGVFSSKEVNIPDSYENEPVVAIGKEAFAGVASIRQVSIPETVVLIDSFAFRGCTHLKEIELPEGLQTLNGESFKNCKKLREIVIPKGVTEIRGNTFEGCRNLEKVELHDGILVIHGYAFRGCRDLKTINLPPAITEIRAYTFERCVNLREIHIPEGVTKIGAHAFKGCVRLQKVTVPWSLLEIRSSAFRECGDLEEIILPKGVIINERAFKDSPTKIYESKFSAGEWELALQEAQEKEPKTLYYVYRKDAPDVVYGQDSKTILIVDDSRYAQKLDSTMGLRALENDAQALEYLEAAKAAGFTEVLYLNYSKRASEITGEDYFLNGDITIDEMIETRRNRLTEEDDG